MTTDGVGLDVDVADATRASLTIEAGVIGDVTVYACYQTLDGVVVRLRPRVVATIDPPQGLRVDLDVAPRTSTIPVDGVIYPTLAMRYAQGLIVRRSLATEDLMV